MRRSRRKRTARAIVVVSAGLSAAVASFAGLGCGSGSGSQPIIRPSTPTPSGGGASPSPLPPGSPSPGASPSVSPSPSPSPSSSPIPEPITGRVIYATSTRGIWLGDAAGGEPQNAVAQGDKPLLSPTGTRMAFVSYRDYAPPMFPNDPKKGEVYLANADGSGQMRITTGAAVSSTGGSGLSWSPDGRRVGFPTIIPFALEDRYRDNVVNADGSGLTVVDKGIGAWLPDGRRLESRQDGFYALDLDAPGGPTEVKLADVPGPVSYKLSPDGTKAAYLDFIAQKFIGIIDLRSGTRVTVPLPGNRRTYSSVLWSPDGARAAFVSTQPAGESAGPNELKLYVVNADGGGLTDVSGDSYVAYLPFYPLTPIFQWVGGSEQLGFLSSGSVITVDRTGVNKVVVRPSVVLPSAYAVLASWSPDGRNVLFAGVLASGPNNVASKLYVMNADGAGLRELAAPGDPINSVTWR